MNLRCMSNTHYGLILIFLALFVLYSCSQGSANHDGQTSKSDSISESDDDRKQRDRDDDDKHSEQPDDGDSGTSFVNFIATHNPRSSQYDDNCLNCHSDIANAQSLDLTVPNAHVAMLPFTPGEDSDQCAWCHRDVSNTLIQTAAQVGAFQSNIRKTVDTQLCAICHGPVGPGKQFYQSGITASADPEGSQLYDFICAACHKELANSEVKGESAEEIYKAIAEDEGGMAALSVLKPTWVQAISVALGGDPTLPADIPIPGTGASLYQQYCSACHANLTSSTKSGASVGQIQNAISNDIGGMGSMGSLTSSQLQSIADALGGVSGGTGGTGGGAGGTDGASLYQTNCFACHGPLSSSSQAGASVSKIQNAINNDLGGMNSLSSLTAAQVQTISNALNGVGGPGSSGSSETDGTALYMSYCASCHDDLGNSEVSGKSTDDISNAIGKNKGGMSSLGFLTNEQIDAIAKIL